MLRVTCQIDARTARHVCLLSHFVKKKSTPVPFVLLFSSFLHHMILYIPLGASKNSEFAQMQGAGKISQRRI